MHADAADAPYTHLDRRVEGGAASAATLHGRAADVRLLGLVDHHLEVAHHRGMHRHVRRQDQAHHRLAEQLELLLALSMFLVWWWEP